MLGAGALLAGGGFLVSPEVRHSSVVAAQAGLWSYSWVLLLFVGGAATCYGWRMGLEEWEALGLTFTGWGCLAYVFGIVATRGLSGWVGACILGSTGIGHLLRAHELRSLGRYP